MAIVRRRQAAQRLYSGKSAERSNRGFACISEATYDLTSGSSQAYFSITQLLRIRSNFIGLDLVKLGLSCFLLLNLRTNLAGE
jgi:hypothetical protein